MNAGNLMGTPAVRVISPYLYLGFVIVAIFLSNGHRRRKDPVLIDT